MRYFLVKWMAIGMFSSVASAKVSQVSFINLKCDAVNYETENGVKITAVSGSDSNVSFNSADHELVEEWDAMFAVRDSEAKRIYLIYSDHYYKVMEYQEEPEIYAEMFIDDNGKGFIIGNLFERDSSVFIKNCQLRYKTNINGS